MYEAFLNLNSTRLKKIWVVNYSLFNPVEIFGLQQVLIDPVEGHNTIKLKDKNESM